MEFQGIYLHFFDIADKKVCHPLHKIGIAYDKVVVFDILVETTIFTPFRQSFPYFEGLSYFTLELNNRVKI